MPRKDLKFQVGGCSPKFLIEGRKHDRFAEALTPVKGGRKMDCIVASEFDTPCEAVCSGDQSFRNPDPRVVFPFA